MATMISAGLLMCKMVGGRLLYFLVHPGGPFFRNKDHGVWTIPKGLPLEGESLLTTAQREFFEETGVETRPPFYEIGKIAQKNGKTVHAWTFKGDWKQDDGIISNTFTIEWPPRSGRQARFPEADRACWLDYEQAARSIIPAQTPFLDRALRIWSQ